MFWVLRRIRHLGIALDSSAEATTVQGVHTIRTLLVTRNEQFAPLPIVAMVPENPKKASMSQEGRFTTASRLRDL